jgi:hypothetical protein
VISHTEFSSSVSRKLVDKSQWPFLSIQKNQKVASKSEFYLHFHSSCSSDTVAGGDQNANKAWGGGSMTNPPNPNLEILGTPPVLGYWGQIGLS